MRGIWPMPPSPQGGKPDDNSRDMDIQDIKKMSPSKRIVLVQEIWDSIDSDSIELTDAIKAELDSRLERHEKGEGQNYTLEEARAKWAEKRK